MSARPGRIYVAIEGLYRTSRRRAMHRIVRAQGLGTAMVMMAMTAAPRTCRRPNHRTSGDFKLGLGYLAAVATAGQVGVTANRGQ